MNFVDLVLQCGVSIITEGLVNEFQRMCPLNMLVLTLRLKSFVAKAALVVDP